MRDVMLVAGREFRQIVATRGFWITLLIVPLFIGLSIFASSTLAPSRGMAYTLVDASGEFEDRLEARLERDYQRQVLRDLSEYVERWGLAAADPDAPWVRRGSWLVEPEVSRFMAEGGAESALASLRPHLPPGAAEFELPERLYYRVPPPGDASGWRKADAFGEAVAPALKEDVQTPGGELPLTLALYIPENFGDPGAPARVWTDGGFNANLLNVVRDELTAALRLSVLQTSGLSAEVAERVQTLTAPIAVVEPAAGERREFFSTRSIIPIALVYLLLLTGITTGSMMLQGLVEERSNKLLEAVLACIQPSALMHGKLLGLGGVGLGIILVWTACAVAAGLSATGLAADLLGSSLASLSEPWVVPAMIFYFLSGYLILSMLFLVIGSLSNSMQEAQAYLGPVLIVIMMPIIIMMQVSLRQPDSVLAQVLSWIPLYTPFAMLARLGTGVSILEVIGTAVMLIAFTALTLSLLGRLFQASVLDPGRRGWRDILGRLRSPAEPTDSRR